MIDILIYYRVPESEAPTPKETQDHNKEALIKVISQAIDRAGFTGDTICLYRVDNDKRVLRKAWY